MDPRFLQHYTSELHHLRQISIEFARANPMTARRLALSSQEEQICPDPYVERLLEGFAFLTARIQLKFETEFPHFTQALLETVYPDFLSPTPAMAIVRFEPNDDGQKLDEGRPIPRGSTLKEEVGKDQKVQKTPCRFRTAHDVQLWPLRMENVTYFTRDFARLGLEDIAPGRAAFRLRLRSLSGESIGNIRVDKLTFHVTGTDDIPWKIFEEIFVHATAVVLRTGANRSESTVLDRSHLRPVGLTDDEALLPPDPRSFQGCRLLREYFTLPQRFLFFEVSGLAEALKDCKGDSFDIIIVLEAQNVALEVRDLSPSTFSLFCTPVINLFERTAEPVSLTDHVSDLRVVGDRSRALDYEIFKIQSVHGHGARTEVRQEFRPFYLRRESDRGHTAAFFTTHRTPRAPEETERGFGPRSEYSGSEVYLSLVDASAAPYRADLRHLTVRALWTNAHLPTLLAPGSAPTYVLDHGPIAKVASMSTPTRPRLAPCDSELAWQLVSHLSGNYYSLVERAGEDGAHALRQLLLLYLPGEMNVMRQQIDAIRSIRALPTTKRVRTTGPISFARGLEITVTIDESAFYGAGIFVLGTVLSHFFANYVALNSFTETVLVSQQRGEVARWKPKIGQRHLI